MLLLLSHFRDLSFLRYPFSNIILHVNIFGFFIFFLLFIYQLSQIKNQFLLFPLLWEYKNSSIVWYKKISSIQIEYCLMVKTLQAPPTHLIETVFGVSDTNNCDYIEVCYFLKLSPVQLVNVRDL